MPTIDVRSSHQKAANPRTKEKSHGQHQYEASHVSRDPWYANKDQTVRRGQINKQLLDVDVTFKRSAKATL